MNTWGFAAAAMVVAAAPALAVTVPVTNYAMPNGNSGSFHYWDLGYTGAGATSTDGAAL